MAKLFLTRASLDTFLTDHDQIEQFERLFNIVNGLAGTSDTVITSALAKASAVALTSTVASDVMTLTLQAGKWDISGMLSLVPGATTSVQALQVALSKTTNALPVLVDGELPVGGEFVFRAPLVNPSVLGDVNPRGLVLPPQRVTLTADTTFYLVVKPTFTVSTLSAYGWLQARSVY